MVDTGLLLRGIVIGFSIAAPVGPIGVLVIRRTLAEGRGSGFFTGLGAATADAFYGAIGAFGVTLISDLLIGGQFWTRLIGGFFLCYLGLRIATALPSEHSANDGGTTRWRAYLSTLFLTLTNPATILSFAAVFAGLGLGNSSGNHLAAAVLVSGVFIGSALWWLLLSGSVNVLRSRITRSTLRWVNRASGGIILGFGLLAFASLL